MRVLVTGAAGFVAPFVERELASRGHEVFATDIARSAADCDIRSKEAVAALVRDVRPDACVHLAGISFVPDAAKDPGLLYSVNIGGTLNLLDAFAALAPGSRFLFVSTAQAYGCTFDPEDTPVTEDAPLYPLSPYAISKAAGEAAVRAYGLYKGLDIRIVRPSNHTGPGQTAKFVVPSFIAQAKEILVGARREFTTGNLESARDFSDVRDIAAAYATILENGESGATYNACSRTRVRIGALLDEIKALTGADAPVVTDKSLWRPTDYSRLLDTTRLRAIGWAPSYTLRDTLSAMIGQPK